MSARNIHIYVKTNLDLLEERLNNVKKAIAELNETKIEVKITREEIPITEGEE
jgi:DNA-directed RNA polymerase subunit K/omega